MPSRPTVRRTEEFDRVAALPRRVLDPALADLWAEFWSSELRIPGAGVALRRWQGMAIAEAVENRGGWFVLPVGFGKTLLAPSIAVALKALRPVLIGPANLRAKTMHDFSLYRGRWRTPDPPPVYVTREELALDKNADILFTIDPDLVCIDEADDLSNPQSAASARIDRFRLARTREECAIVAYTGTPSRNSILAYWHILWWCLPDTCPLPCTQTEARMWAAALDERGESTGRVDAGPLGPTRKAALQWFRTRLQETPGVIVIDGDSAVHEGKVVPLVVRQRIVKDCPKLDAAFRAFAGADGEQVDPDGNPCATPLERWRLDAFLGCGFFPRYVKPGPPREWIERRRARGRAFAALCRDTIQSSRRKQNPVDTEKQVRRRHKGHPVIAQWDEVADDPYPKEAVWLSAATIEDAIAWLRESNEAGIVWTGSIEFGEALALAARLPYYGPRGQDQNGNELFQAKPGKSFVCSWNANKKGFDLQPWRRHAVYHPPSSAKWLEQLFGRSHRAGQDRAVVVDMAMTSGATQDAFESALDEARFAKSSVGPSQKILRAQIERAKPRPTASNRYRWARAE